MNDLAGKTAFAARAVSGIGLGMRLANATSIHFRTAAAFLVTFRALANRRTAHVAFTVGLLGPICTGSVGFL